MPNEKTDTTKFGILGKALLARENNVEREFWQAAYIAAIHAKLAGSPPDETADTALAQLRQRRADMYSHGVETVLNAANKASS